MGSGRVIIYLMLCPKVAGGEEVADLTVCDNLWGVRELMYLKESVSREFEDLQGLAKSKPMFVKF
jgi:hypothetical protein